MLMLEVEPHHTIEDVKAQIEDKSRRTISTYEQELSKDGEILKNDLTLAMYGIKEQSVLCLRSASAYGRLRIIGEIQAGLLHA